MTAAHHGRGSDDLPQALVRGVRAGAGLHFPSAAEAITASERLAAAAQAKADELAIIRRQQGSLGPLMLDH